MATVPGFGYARNAQQTSIGKPGLWCLLLGSHVIWLSGSARFSTLAGRRIYVMSMVLHAEDRYNFNPGAQDI
jgi:hypothetical protein